MELTDYGAWYALVSVDWIPHALGVACAVGVLIGIGVGLAGSLFGVARSGSD